MIREDRSLGILILLSFVTCGIYSLYFYHQLAKDMNVVCQGDGDNTRGIGMYILFNILTCGIYSYIWFYQVGRRQQDNAGRYGLNIHEGGSAVVLWMIFGAFIIVGPFIAVNIIIKNMNALARAYNSGMYSKNSNVQGNSYGMNGNKAERPMIVQNNEFNNTSGDMLTRDSAVTEPIKNERTQTIQLRCTNGEFAGYSFPVGENERVLIGRDMNCNIKFDVKTPMVSRNHCVFEYDGTNAWLTDNNSSYGTFLGDGTKIEPMKRVMLLPGTSFYLGSKEVMFSV